MKLLTVFDVNSIICDRRIEPPCPDTCRHTVSGYMHRPTMSGYMHRPSLCSKLLYGNIRDGSSV